MQFKFKNLDSIRTIAFLTTFCAHNFATIDKEVESSWLYNAIQSFKSIFNFGVPLFFVLSGFLISYLMLMEFAQKSSFGIKNFYLRRVFRIWPLYYLIFIIGFLIFPIVRQVVLKEAPDENANPYMYLAFLSNFDQLNTGLLPIGVGLGPTWSVSVEEQFYLVWPLLFSLFLGKRFIYGIIISLFSSLILSLVFQLHAKHTVFCIIYLSSGAALAYLHYQYPSLSKKLTNIHPVLFIGVVMMTLLLMKTGTSLVVFVPNALIQLVLAFLMAYIILHQIQCKPSMDLKNAPGLEYWGKYTYGLYLYHSATNFIAFTLAKFLGVYAILGFWTTDLIFRPVVSLILSLLVSYYSYHYFEKYFLSLKEKYK